MGRAYVILMPRIEVSRLLNSNRYAKSEKVGREVSGFLNLNWEKMDGFSFIDEKTIDLGY